MLVAIYNLMALEPVPDWAIRLLFLLLDCYFEVNYHRAKNKNSSIDCTCTVLYERKGTTKSVDAFLCGGTCVLCVCHAPNLTALSLAINRALDCSRLYTAASH